MPRSNIKILTTFFKLPGVKVVGYTEVNLTEVIMTIEAEKQEAICPRCNQLAIASKS